VGDRRQGRGDHFRRQEIDFGRLLGRRRGGGRLRGWRMLDGAGGVAFRDFDEAAGFGNGVGGLFALFEHHLHALFGRLRGGGGGHVFGQQDDGDDHAVHEQ
jgi:hypothetical protein